MDYKNVWQKVDKNEYDEIFAYSKKIYELFRQGKDRKTLH